RGHAPPCAPLPAPFRAACAAPSTPRDPPAPESAAIRADPRDERQCPPRSARGGRLAGKARRGADRRPPTTARARALDASLILRGPPRGGVEQLLELAHQRREPEQRGLGTECLL